MATWNDSHQEPELNLGLPEYGKHSKPSFKIHQAATKQKHRHLQPCPYLPPSPLPTWNVTSVPSTSTLPEASPKHLNRKSKAQKTSETPHLHKMWQVRKITGHVFLVKIPNNRFWGTLPLQTFLPPKTHSCGKKQFFWVQNLSSSPRNTKWKEMHLYMARKTSEASSLVSNLGPEEPPRNRPVFGWNLTTPSGSIDKTLLKTNVTDWKIPMFNRKYIFIHGGVSTVVLGSIYTSTCKSTRCRWTLCIDIVYIYIHMFKKI